jgi:hypothetical protein
MKFIEPQAGEQKRRGLHRCRRSQNKINKLKQTKTKMKKEKYIK